MKKDKPKKTKTKKRKVEAMAIVRSTTGKFYDLDENILEGKEVKQEDLPKEMQQSGPDPAMMGAGGGPGGPGGSGLIQIIVNVPQGTPPPPGAAAPGAEGEAAAEGDVAGHGRRHHGGGQICWGNYWQNCWRNCWRNNVWQNFCWYNCG